LVLFKLSIESIHGAFIVGAVSHPEHVAGLVDHHMASIVKQCLLSLLGVWSLTQSRVIPHKTEYTRARLVSGPPKHIVPAGPRIQVLHSYCQHAICVRRNKRNRFLENVRGQELPRSIHKCALPARNFQRIHKF
jgi:hypothetical protein